MSDNRILELLKNAKVDWKPLEDIAKIYGGLSGKTKNDFENGNSKYISYKEIFNNLDIKFNDFCLVKISKAEKQNEVKYGDILFTGSSETVDEVGMSSVITKKFNDKVYLNSFSFGLRFNDNINILPEFSKYLFRCFYIRKHIIKCASGVTRFNLSKKRLNKIQIPIPPLEIQSEIVRILDSFTALTTELTIELTIELNARKKQYNYYRDQLLTFSDDEVEWKKFGCIVKIQRGASPRPITKYITENVNGIPWIKIGDTSPDSKYVESTAQKITIDGANKSRLLKKGDFIISNSMSYGRPYILKIDGAIHDGWASISDFDNELNSDYLYHYLSSNNVQNYWKSKINSSSVSNLNSDIIKNLEIPVPPLKKQAEIVEILDKFDSLTTSITEGLPREIELRKKQYEYYRDLLLTFPKPDNK